MENKTKVFIALTIIFAFVTILLSVTVIYLIKNPTVIVSEKEKAADVEDKKIATVQYNYNLSKRKEHQAVREENIEIFVDTDGNAYLYTIGDVQNISEANIKENLKKLEKEFSIYSPKNYDYYSETSIKAYKLNISNVLTVYNVGMGNGGFRYFVFLKENGELSYLNYDNIIYEGQINVKSISNLKNVVSVVDNEYTQTPYAVTIDGNEVSLYEYIK